jgi:hypothetical protein
MAPHKDGKGLSSLHFLVMQARASLERLLLPLQQPQVYASEVISSMLTLERIEHAVEITCECRPRWILFFSVQTNVSWRTLFIIWYSNQHLVIKVQSCPVLR